MHRGLIFLSLFFILSCNSLQPPPFVPGTKSVDFSQTGAIQGQVLFKGTPPESTRIPVARFKECGRTQGADEDVLIHQGRVQNAFIFIRQGLEDYRFESPSQPALLDQSRCLYTPRVLGLQIGQSLIIRNSDTFLHNVHAQPKMEKGFNIGMASVGVLHKVFSQPEVMVPIRCDVHPWMRAFVGVLPHPYYAVSDVEGRFSLANVPAGQYTLEVWHERLGRLTAPVTVTAGEVHALMFSFSEK